MSAWACSSAWIERHPSIFVNTDAEKGEGRGFKSPQARRCLSLILMFAGQNMLTLALLILALPDAHIDWHTSIFQLAFPANSYHVSKHERLHAGPRSDRAKLLIRVSCGKTRARPNMLTQAQAVAAVLALPPLLFAPPPSLHLETVSLCPRPHHFRSTPLCMWLCCAAAL